MIHKENSPRLNFGGEWGSAQVIKVKGSNGNIFYDL